MFVLMDMEWIENKMHYFCPTQVSAMRVDNRWNRIDCYDALIQPFDASCKDGNISLTPAQNRKHFFRRMEDRGFF